MPDFREVLKESLKDGVDIEAILAQVPKNPLESLVDKDEALALMQKHKVLTSALDYHTTKKIEDHDARKLPELEKQIREKLEKEFQKQETPEQKRIRELEEKLAAGDRKSALHKEAAKLKIDPAIAERYVIFGDDAVKFFQADMEVLAAEKTKIIDEAKKEFFKGNPPKGTEPVKNTREALLAELTQAEKEKNVARMFAIKEQLRKLPADE